MQLCLSTLAWAKEGGATLSYWFPNFPLNFPYRLSGWEGLRATLSLDYELTPLPVHSMGTPHARYWLCCGYHQLCLPSSQLKQPWAALLLGVTASPSGYTGPEDTPLWEGL